MFSQDQVQQFLKLSTPFYYYDLNLLDATLESLCKESGQYGYHIHYALKANVDNRLLTMIRDKGLGADCVSGNEVKKAFEMGFEPAKIVFAGVGKTDNEINTGLQLDISCFNCESVQELKVIDLLASQQNKKAVVALRINPNVSANTHKYITTGLEENKFGINMWEMDEVLAVIKACKNIVLKGIHFHIGSQITDLNSFKNLCTRVNDIQKWLNSRNVIIDHVNVGGGLGVDYHAPDEHPVPDFRSYFKVFEQFLELMPHQQLHFELGRAVVAQCGSLIARVLYVKKGVNTNFAILDAGMTELIRPALYQSYHKIENISSVGKMQRYDVVGPICESSDCFGKAVMLPEISRGDLIAIRSVGAYGEVMSSFYNLRDKAAAIYNG